jgi:hypothetical protein
MRVKQKKLSTSQNVAAGPVREFIHFLDYRWGSRTTLQWMQSIAGKSHVQSIRKRQISPL